MASVSFSLTLNGGGENVLGASGSQVITEGTSAPGAGDLEIRINLADSWNKVLLREAFEQIWRYLDNPNTSTSIPL